MSRNLLTPFSCFAPIINAIKNIHVAISPIYPRYGVENLRELHIIDAGTITGHHHRNHHRRRHHLQQQEQQRQHKTATELVCSGLAGTIDDIFRGAFSAVSLLNNLVIRQKPMMGGNSSRFSK